MTKAIISSGYGINCERETKHAIELAGGKAEIIHINDLKNDKKILKQTEILVFAGGFSYGDDLGSGLAYAKDFLNNLKSELEEFINDDKLVLGICNGNQILTILGAIPGLKQTVGRQEVVITNNDNTKYTDIPVYLKTINESIFLKELDTLLMPVAHGEGKYYMSEETLKKLKENKQIALTYVRPDGTPANGHFPYSPNGSMIDIAGITNKKGNVLGLMPHPERAIHFTQHPLWTKLKEEYRRKGKEPPIYCNGLKIFKNMVNYFR
jgi:phosphoribosylformylglycinamidine synthase